ncbi:MAG: GGDEF domain-containing protein [Deltaproteobacteria bacterium]|nr:GGDEF domain-containing protein [Deltaproteobacteria bacterium]
MSRSVLIARPVWPVLSRLGEELRTRGFPVVFSSSWGVLLESRFAGDEFAAVLLGEYGAVTEEEEILRKFRERGGGIGVPVVLAGGANALSRARGFRSAGVDLVVPADLPAGEIFERLQPLLSYGEMYRNALAENRELRDRSTVDDLTGLPNRRQFSRELERNVEMARRIGRPLSCIVTDIDDIRRVYEAFGPPVGDSVIRQFGGVLNRARRRYDSVARLGGDEFVWLLVDADAGQATAAARRAQRMISESVFNGTHEPVRVTATWGVASLTPGAEWTASLLVENADRALYWGKESGKNVVRCYPPGKAAFDA